MARKQFALAVLFLLLGFRRVALAQIPDGTRAPQAPGSYGLMGDNPDDSPTPGGISVYCDDPGFAIANAECPSPGSGGEGNIGPPPIAAPMRPPHPPIPAPGIGSGVGGLGILPGENSINFPVDPLLQTLWQEVLGLPSDLSCPQWMGPMCGGINPALDASPADKPTANYRTKKECQHAAYLRWWDRHLALDNMGNVGRDTIEGVIAGCATGWETGCLPGAAVGAGISASWSLLNHWWDTRQAVKQAEAQYQADLANCH